MPRSLSTKPSPAIARWVAVPLLITYLVLVVSNAWLSDDAYITFRTVDNVVNGYGLTWNVVERVQAYTHPLWMLLLSAFYAVTHEIYFTSLVVSIAISLAAAAVVAFGVARGRLAAVSALVALSLSKAFVDYSTSGLENPLTHLILVSFVWVYADDRRSTRRVALLATLAALGMVNRIDAGLLMLPALAHALWETRSRRSVIAGLLGFLPLVTWELFSLFYYGAIVPNTALAKLNAGLIPASALHRAGLAYLLNSLRVDPITLTTIVVGVLLSIASREWRRIALALGAVLYVAYVVRVGGDFMSGRFLTAPFLLSVASLAWAPSWSQRLPAWSTSALLAVLSLVLGLSTPYSPIRSRGGERADADPRVWVQGRGITDERANYYHNTGLVEALRRGVTLPDHDWAIEGRLARASGPAVVVKGSVGFYGYFAGPEVHVVDLLALGDPLLARLPVVDPDWRIGHFGRRLPQGYFESLESGENRIADPDLATYYGKLSDVTRGSLWDPQRLLTLLHLNTGRYDRYLDAYAYYRGPALVQTLEITNPTERPYVYAYVWNNGAGETYLLDRESSQGKAYIVRWEIGATGVLFQGSHDSRVAQIGPLSDSEPLNVGVLFSDDPALDAYEAFERRFWFRWGQSDSDSITVVFPALEWYNGEAPGGYWREVDIDTVIGSQ